MKKMSAYLQITRRSTTLRTIQVLQLRQLSFTTKTKTDGNYNKCTIGELVRLWSRSITQFPEGKGELVAGELKVTVQDLPVIMSLENDGQEIFDALKECQWIDERDGIIVIPKWDMKIGQTIIKLEKDLERKKAGGL